VSCCEEVEKVRMRVSRIFAWIGLCVAGFACGAQAAPFAYVAARGSGAVTVLDTATQAVVAAIPVGPGPMATAVHPDGSLVYVTLGPLDAVAVIDTASNAVIGTVGVGDNPSGLDVSPDGSTLFVANTGARSVSVLDARTRVVRGTVALANHPFALAVHPDGSKLYVGGDFPGHVTVIDAATRQVTATIPIGDSLGGLALHPSGRFLYVADSGADALVVVDTLSQQVVARVGVGRIPVGVAVHPSGGAVYVANLLSAGVVSMIDTGTNTHVATFEQPGLSLAQGIGIRPDGRVLYVVSRGTHDVVTFDTETGQSFGERIAVGGEPTGFGRFVGPGAVTGATPIPAAAPRAPAPPAAPLAPRAAPEIVSIPADVALMPGAAIAPEDDVVYSLGDCIWVQDLQTGRQTPITGRPSSQDASIPVCDEPALRPLRHVAVDATRTKIAFNVGEDFGGQVETSLYVIDLPSRTTRQLLPEFARIGVGGIDFTPNGDLYTAGVALGDAADPRVAEESEVFRVAADLSAWAQVTRLPNRGSADVSVSADGTKLAFNTLVLSTGNLEVIETSIDGSAPRVVIQGGAIWQDSVHDPEHSPDGAKVVYSRMRLRLPGGAACGPNWSGGGDRCQDLFTQPVAGGTPTRVTPPGATSIVPDWKGGVLLFHLGIGSATQPGSWIGAVAGTDDGRVLVPFGPNVLFPKWMP
jgi:YVTN family beta-propeller protein